MDDEVFAISGGRFYRQPLENQEIGFRCLADLAGQHGMDLPGVMDLIIELAAATDINLPARGPKAPSRAATIQPCSRPSIVQT
jgi:hypothetical protein